MSALTDILTRENGRKITKNFVRLDVEGAYIEGSHGVLDIVVECGYHTTTETLYALQADVDEVKAFIQFLEGWVAKTEEDV